MICMAYVLYSCAESKNKVSEQEFINTSEALVGANRIMVGKDREKIVSYIERIGWDMIESQTGLWSQIYTKGHGVPAVKGKFITLSYTLSILDGSVCYTSDSLGYKQFLIGSGGVESGLEEGVLLLREGDKARFILPPHLAQGLTGDGNKIPPRAIIVYDVEVINIK
jgi:FKBP-type peptidyl-prolyl cis-trans isomerase FkpA